MDDVVFFFPRSVICQHCEADTFGLVFEHSGIVSCTECEEALLDCHDTDGGTIIMLELEDNAVH